MQLTEGKARFIESWGKLGSSWGISRTMAQLHALLLITPKALCADQIMNALQISRGNVNLNIRALCDWGLVHKELKPGDRKEYFIAEKDIMLAMKQIISHRKKKELDPMKKLLDEISCVECQCQDSEEFCKVVNELKLYTNKVDKTLERLLNSESEWIYHTLFKVLR
jgi:DNA-binding transcriptional regulator GbsR (MarR family)